MLVVDDDRGVRNLLDIVLGEHGLTVWLTADGDQALKTYIDHSAEIDLVLLDVRMPGRDGPETLEELRKLNPLLRCCFMTADSGRYTENELMALGAEYIFFKPLSLVALGSILDRLISSNHSSGEWHEMPGLPRHG